MGPQTKGLGVTFMLVPSSLTATQVASLPRSHSLRIKAIKALLRLQTDTDAPSKVRKQAERTGM